MACIETQFPNQVVTAGTGTLVGPRMLLTAGHVVYDPVHGGKPRSFRVTLGNAPRQSFTATNWRTSGKWFKTDSKLSMSKRALSSADVGVVILDNPIDSMVASLKYETTKTEVINAMTLNVAGYSNDATLIPNTAFFASSRGTTVPQASYRMSYPIHTIAGMSGGPVWSRDPSQVRTVRAIHTSLFDGAGNALRITTSVFRLLQKWQNQFHPTAQAA